jgi:hypothetical protein
MVKQSGGCDMLKFFEWFLLVTGLAILAFGIWLTYEITKLGD